MGETTKLANLIDPEVLAAYIDKKLIDNIVFAPLATVDQTLVGAPGDIIKFPAYAFIGQADDLTEGSAISTVSLNASTVSAKVKEAGKGVEITDTAILSAYGDPVEEIASQLLKSMADKVDADFLTVLGGIGAGMTYSTAASTCAITVLDISNSLEKFGEDIDGRKALIVSPRTYTKIRNTKDWAPASEFAANALVRGAVGQIFGCDIIVSNRLRQTAVAGEKAFIVKPGALRLILKRDTLLEADRDILRRVNVFTATKHYVDYLYNAAGAIKIMTPSA
jgi:N4-gp56 family major capsid protein